MYITNQDRTNAANEWMDFAATITAAMEKCINLPLTHFWTLVEFHEDAINNAIGYYSN
jgi:hypothetical protein